MDNKSTAIITTVATVLIIYWGMKYVLQQLMTNKSIATIIAFGIAWTILMIASNVIKKRYKK